MNVITIELPKLVERAEDIPRLAAEFVKQFAARNGRNVNRVTDEAIGLLLDYDFPGNVRELRNIIEQSVLSAGDEIVGPEHLPEYLRSTARLIHSHRHKPSLAEIEALYISEVLDYTRGNKTRAAEILGISRKNLYEKMKRYNIAMLRAERASLN